MGITSIRLTEKTNPKIKRLTDIKRTASRLELTSNAILRKYPIRLLNINAEKE